MKSLSDFTKKSKVAEANITKDKFYKNEVYKQGEWVLTEQGQVGKIHRRGPNYVLCLTAENTKFRSWITDIKEVFEIGTDAYREYVMSVTPGQKVAKPKNTVKVPETIPSKHPTNKMDKHESKSLAELTAETLNTNVSDHLNSDRAFSYNRFDETWRYDYSAKMANTDVKGLGADGVGGGDAPGMKLAEPKGEEGKPEVKKVKHACATKVEHSEWGKGNTLKEMHTLDEQGNITHYDVMFEHGLEQDVPVPTLNILVSEMHEHVINTDKNEVEEGLDPVNPMAVKKKFKDRKDKDLDNDGDTDSSDKYLHKKRKAISKAMKKEHHQKDADGKVIEHEEEADGTPSSVEEASLATARKNIGRDPKKPSCWDGYKAKGTKMKGGKSVPNCVKEFKSWRKDLLEKK